jgi:uncharacterized protein YdhG (YjbR/CyaY superfamily)
MPAKLAAVDRFIASVKDDKARATLEHLRRSIPELVPQAEEVFSYGLPGFRYRDRPLVYYGAARHHCALYGLMTEEHRDLLANYDTSKGTIRFPSGKPPAKTLLKKLLTARVREIDAAAEKKRAKLAKQPARR